MLRTKMVAAALTVALSLVAIPESFARGGFGGHAFGGFGGGARFAGARIGGIGVRPFVGGIRPVGVRPFIGAPRFAFRRRPFFPIFPLAIGAGLAYGAYPYYDPYYPYYYDDTTYVPLQNTATPDAIAACAQRYRTYDPATQTFVGRGGVRLPCP